MRAELLVRCLEPKTDMQGLSAHADLCVCVCVSTYACLRVFVYNEDTISSVG
jgi:hypothetical protein